MKKTAEVLIVGGGVMGASVAYHCASQGCKNILVIDQGNEPGLGSTGKATGGFRCQFSTEINIKLSLLSRQKLIHFKEEHGVDSGYRPYGYLFLAQHERELSALRSTQTIQRQCGLHEASEVTITEIQELNPSLVLKDIVGGVFCPTDGFIHPTNILLGYIRSAQRLGVQFEFGSECREMIMKNARIDEVTTSKEKISIGNVVNAAGAWAGVVARKAGVELPVTPLRRQVAVVKESGVLPETTPMTIFVGDGFHFRVRDGRVLLLMPTNIPSSFETHLDDAWIQQVHTLARERVIPLSLCSIDRQASWAGLYEMSPDKHAILGRAAEFENCYLINGSSGHGVMHSPALGQLLSEVILNGAASTIDIRQLRPSRFAEGQPNPLTEVL